MAGFLLRFIVGSFALWLAAQVVPGFSIVGLHSLLIAALLLGLANAVLRPILVILTLPITIMTLGLFLLVINGLMIGLVAALLDKVTVTGLFPAILAAIVTGVVNWLVQGLLGLREKPAD